MYSQVLTKSPKKRSSFEKTRAVDWLRSLGCPLFYNISDEILLKVCGSVRLHTSLPNTVVFSEGESAQFLLLLLSGSMDIFTETSVNKRQRRREEPSADVLEWGTSVDKRISRKLQVDESLKLTRVKL